MSDADTALLARCAAIAVSSWSDALDELGIAGVVSGIAQRSGQGRMCGFAVTARQVAGELGAFDKSDFGVGSLVAATGPGNVLVIDVGGEPISTLGGLASLACTMRSATGVVIDGACRDVDEIRETGLWLASRHVAPTTGKRRLRLQPLGGQVTIGGIDVAEGDLVVGDDTGIVIVPRASLGAALEAADRIVAVDHEVERRIRAGTSFADAAAASGYLPGR
ncbi:RraA family protein [Enterovirga rhinocerotis]|uniref:Putative 4-hydroxy-4-methyl-2-oxoglutarate aldolase n=1 Tax=Enterovirga rhinocerotis TaxID=1339210 RepID=A0A4R7BS20_9HYPH|nr:RraA family protein [Enterovirga rhinocerotis]TDR88191.1 regulator of RNase E activity RraA [Enterovirga rhinocerotis]